MKNTVATFQKMKENGEKISMLTCYDYSTAKLEEAAGINGILVGDSLGNVMLGLPDTLSVTMEHMITYGSSVARACHDTMVVIDMPFMSYQESIELAVHNAGRLMKEGRANAVKLEGGAAVCPQIQAITACGIPVMAHIGSRFARETGAYLYYFDLDAPGDDNAAFHSCDLRYAFGTLEGSWRPYGARDHEASGQLVSYLANFARSGDPNGPGLPLWRPCEKHRTRLLRIAPRTTAMGHANYAKLALHMLTKGEPKA